MTKNIAIIYGHPDPSSERLCADLTDAYERSVQMAGHEVRRINVTQLEFDSIISSEDFKHGRTPTDILKSQDIILWADHLLLIFPLWMGTMPGQFKMFLEQVFRPDFALDYSRTGFPGKMLKGKTADIIVTMGMPKIAYEGFYFSHGIRNLRRNILHFCGIKPVRVTYVGGVENPAEKDLIKWRKKVAGLTPFLD